MSTTLILRLAGPMQAWGLQSRFSDRDTAREPTKSGVLGLVCAALGKPRDERPGDGFPLLADLAALRMGVRVDREGQPRYDYQTAQDVLIASTPAGRLQPGKLGKNDLKPTEPSTRHYLADAWFTVGLEGDRTLLERIDTALAAPRWPLALGRKAFPPGLPVRVLLPGGRPALFDCLLVEALSIFVDHPKVEPPAPSVGQWRIVLDASAATDTVDAVARRMQPDHPLSFAPRRFAPREVVVGTLHPLPADVPQ
jgi:CRISPR system Cascade subunit CasD